MRNTVRIGVVALLLAGIATLAQAADPGRLAAIRPDVSICLVAGMDDPLAGEGAAVAGLGVNEERTI